MSAQARRANLLDRLPNEILLPIMANMPGLMALNDFLTAYPQSKPLYGANYKDLLTCILRRSHHPQIQKLICAILFLRKPSTKAEVDAFDPSFDHCLEMDSSPTTIEHDITDPISTLSEMSAMSQYVTRWEKSYIVASRPSPFSVTSDREDAPSAERSFRIGRAFWRLRLLRELQSRYCNGRNYPDWYSRERAETVFIFNRIGTWDFEEKRCACFYLNAKFEDPDSSKDSYSIPCMNRYIYESAW